MKHNFLDRDLSTLSFNRRVLSLAERDDYPLLERLRFLCIVATNLDEFFEVRMSHQIQMMRQHHHDHISESYEQLSKSAHELVARQYQLFDSVLMPALAKEGVHLVSGHVRTPEQIRWVEQYFKREVKPLLVPVALDPSHPFPQVANKSLNFIVELEYAHKKERNIAIVRVPRVVPRVVQMPTNVSNGEQCFVSLTSIIRANLDDLFNGAKVLSFSQFRVTRNSDMALDEDDVVNLRTALREELAHRQYGAAVRLEVSQECRDDLADFLLEQFDLPQQALYPVNGPVNLGRLIQLPDMAAGDHLKFKAYQPKWTPALRKNQSILEQIKTKDVLIHQPFESFDPVIQMLEEAVKDEHVLAIRQTIYRTGADSRILRLLQEAVRRGKEVMVVVELKARFDEEANINWAEALESIGAQVVYGVVGLKTHAKMLLIMRREGRMIKRYAHLSTGNYNPKTAKLYTDLCMLTSNADITREMEYVFRYLTSELPLPAMRELLVAPFSLQDSLIRQIKKAISAVSKGGKARIMLKMNSLTDEPLAAALMDAGASGVEIDIIVRGACILPVDTPKLEGRVKVRSIVGRFLEHSRAFYFEIDDHIDLWLASADWMSRNMVRRVEIAWPIHDAAMQQRIVNECFAPYLADTLDAFELGADGEYKAMRLEKNPKPVSAQQYLMQLHGG
jgi:polyphosphate kinase